MARKLKKSKVSICVFCEGESEQAYTDFLKSKFQDVAVFKRPSSTGLFDDAYNRFKKDPKYRDYADVIDEIWFFFDVEEKDIDNWSKRLEIIKRLPNEGRESPRFQSWEVSKERELYRYGTHCPTLSNSS